MTPQMKRILWILKCAKVDPLDVTVCDGYAEPGYPDGVVVLGNWNNINRRVSDLIERAGGHADWSDEYLQCSKCGKAVRTKPDCYEWAPSYIEFEDENYVACTDCFDEDKELREQYYESRTAESIPYNMNFGEDDFFIVGPNFQHGLHRGQDDSPEKLQAFMAKLHRESKLRHPWFLTQRPSQFYYDFFVVMHEEDIESLGGEVTVTDLLETVRSGLRCKFPPAELMKKALQACPSGQGVCVTVHTDTETGEIDYDVKPVAEVMGDKHGT